MYSVRLCVKAKFTMSEKEDGSFDMTDVILRAGAPLVSTFYHSST